MSSDLTSRACPTGVLSHAQAAACPAGVAS